jgi:dihydroflavonol-4-reductase
MFVYSRRFGPGRAARSLILSRNAFVTGGTGLLGTNLVRELVGRGWKVKVLARSREKAQRVLEGLVVEVVIGDMENVAGFAPALENSDTLFHCAAYFREYYAAGEHRKKLEQINVEGTLRLLGAAETAGVHKVVYVSSSGVLDHAQGAGSIDETAPYAQATDNLYFQSKIRAEERVLEWLTSHRLPVVLVLPGWMFGPFDEAPTASGRLVCDFLAGKLPGIIPGGASVVDARDVADAMIKAAETGRPGERYVVGGTLASLEEIVRTLQTVTGKPGPRLRIPYPIAVAVAWLSQTAAMVFGGDTLLTVSGVRTMREAMKHKLSSAKAQRELGISFRPLIETLRDEVDWIQRLKTEG